MLVTLREKKGGQRRWRRAPVQRRARARLREGVPQVANASDDCSEDPPGVPMLVQLTQTGARRGQVARRGWKPAESRSPSGRALP
jgi:hypothetical protein